MAADDISTPSPIDSHCLLATWQARVALGSLPQSGIVADRAFNATSAHNARPRVMAWTDQSTTRAKTQPG